jgi:repressor LexA
MPEDMAAVEIPLLGRVAAGRPIEALPQNQEQLSVPASLTARVPRCFALQVQGDSMMDEGILDGDYVVLEPRETADNGEVVVALLNGDEATLKRFYRENGHIRLQPSNAAMEPIIVTSADIAVQGVVVGLVRHYRLAARRAG